MKKKKLLSDYIIEDIKTMLRDGRLKEGDKLPNQSEFANQLGVSRLSLREALRSLEMMGAVQQKPKTGTIILKGNPDQWESPMRKIELKDESDTKQMILARKCVETTVAVEAAKRITRDEINFLTQIYFEMYDTIRRADPDGFLAKDKEFHNLIGGACGNKYLKSMYEIALSQVDVFMKDVFEALPDAFEKIVRPHREIYEALTERDPVKVKRSIKHHTESFEDILDRFFRQGEEPHNGSLYYP